MAKETGHQISRARFSQAATVLDFAPDLADSVVTGVVPLDKAYETARDRKRAAESTDALMASLRRDAPDLADQVTEERLQLNEALAALRARQAEEQRRRGRNPAEPPRTPRKRCQLDVSATRWSPLVGTDRATGSAAGL